MKVEILSRKVITPSSPTSSHLAHLKISFLDQFLTFYYATIFYYEASNINYAERSEQLQKSLSQILTLFYPLAGRYNKDNLSIDCKDMGVEYFEAHVSGSFSQIIKGGELLNSLVPQPCQPESSPLILFQFNKFEDGGVAIAVCVNHMVADGFTIFTFMNAWSTSCRLGIEKVKYCPSFQLSFLCPLRDKAPLQGRHEGKNKTATRSFVFNGETISKLKSAASYDDADGLKVLKQQPTRFEVVTAQIWSVLIKVAQARYGRMRPSLFTFPVNMRERTSLPIPKCSCGNFAATAIAKFMPDDQESCSKQQVQLHDLIRIIHDAIERVISNWEKATSGDDLFYMEDNAMKEINLAHSKSDEMDAIVISSWCKFPLYETDFGFGKPDWISPMDVQVDNIGCLLDTKDGERIEAWLILEEKNMLLFQQYLVQQ